MAVDLSADCHLKTLVLLLQRQAAYDSDGVQALFQLVGELHACPSVSTIITSRIKPVSKHLLELPPLDADSAVSLLRQHSGARSHALQAEGAGKLVRLCGCNALLLQVLGAMIASGRCQLEVRSGVDHRQLHTPLCVISLLRPVG